MALLCCLARRCWQRVFTSGPSTVKTMPGPQALQLSAQQYLKRSGIMPAAEASFKINPVLLGMYHNHATNP